VSSKNTSLDVFGNFKKMAGVFVFWGNSSADKIIIQVFKFLITSE
jgi:hypothetical protein